MTARTLFPRGVVVGAWILVFALGVPAFADDRIPAVVQVALFRRILEYDRTLKARVGDDVVLGIVSNPADKSSGKAAAGIQQVFQTVAASEKIQGLTVKLAAHTFRTPADLEAWMRSENVDVMYLAPGMSHAVAEISALATQHKIISISPVRTDVEQGIALGITTRDEAPRVLVNLKSAQAVGMELDSKLLQLAEVLR